MWRILCSLPIITILVAGLFFRVSLYDFLKHASGNGNRKPSESAAKKEDKPTGKVHPTSKTGKSGDDGIEVARKMLDEIEDASVKLRGKPLNWNDAKARFIDIATKLDVNDPNAADLRKRFATALFKAGKMKLDAIAEDSKGTFDQQKGLIEANQVTRSVKEHGKRIDDLLLDFEVNRVLFQHGMPPNVEPNPWEQGLEVLARHAISVHYSFIHDLVNSTLVGKHSARSVPLASVTNLAELSLARISSDAGTTIPTTVTNCEVDFREKVQINTSNEFGLLAKSGGLNFKVSAKNQKFKVCSAYLTPLKRAKLDGLQPKSSTEAVVLHIPFERLEAINRTESLSFIIGVKVVSDDGKKMWSNLLGKIDDSNVVPDATYSGSIDELSKLLEFDSETLPQKCKLHEDRKHVASPPKFVDFRLEITKEDREKVKNAVQWLNNLRVNIDALDLVGGRGIAND